MEITVLYFATLKDRAGKKRERLTLPAGTTIGGLRDRLAALHSGMAESLATALFSINREYAFPSEELHEGDEVAIFPPVSGGDETKAPTIIRITEERLDLNTMIDSIIVSTTGAACVFTGLVRAQTERQEPHETDFLEYEAYVPMAEEKMRQVADEIRQGWPSVEGILLVQRIGRLEPGTPTVMIACSAAHRDTGVFEAARYGIDRLKQIVPIWKKEFGPSGEVWVEGDYLPNERDRNR